MEEEPELSKRTRVLGKNNCFRLNSKLNFKKDVLKASYTQNQYIAIDLFFKLSVESRLFLKEINNKNKFKLAKTPLLEEFLKLNIYEKYVFILEAFWSTYDFEEELSYGLSQFLYLLNEIKRSKRDSKILKDTRKHGGLFSYYSNTTKILRILGICELELIHNVKNKYDDSIKSIIPTDFGEKISGALILALEYINVEYYMIDRIEEELNSNEEKVDKTFIEIISTVFEYKLINKTVNYNIEINRKGTYILKVILEKNIWRIFKVKHNTKLHEVHLIIQEVFDFDNDHMYSFYDGISYRNGKEFYSADPLGESDEYEDLTVEDIELYKGKEFGYLFDFGDMWDFKIQVIDFIENEEEDIQIIDSKGKSPQQYPNW